MANLQLVFEDWRYIFMYEGRYLISNRGRIISLARKIVYQNGKVIYKKQIVMVNKPSTGGYLMILLRKNNDPKPFLVHRLVATSFLPNPDNLPQVNHIRGDKKDNLWYMLEWCTQSQNMRHAVDNDLASKPPIKFGKENNKSKRVVDTQSGKEYETIRDAIKDLHIGRSKAAKILANKHPLFDNLKFIA